MTSSIMYGVVVGVVGIPYFLASLLMNAVLLRMKRRGGMIVVWFLTAVSCFCGVMAVGGEICWLLVYLTLCMLRITILLTGVTIVAYYIDRYE